MSPKNGLPRAKPRKPAQPGEQFGDWTVVRCTGRRNETNTGYLCRCVCGHEGVVNSSNLYQGRSRGCAICGRKKATVTYRLRHPRPVCLDCGGSVSVNVASSKVRRCRPCSVKARTGVPYKHPESISVVAVRCGVTRQAVSAAVIKHGWDTAMAMLSQRTRKAVAA